jgi:tRNA(fMet)-specific endonuclease VapC
MGLLIDTDVLVLAERGKVGLDLGRYLDYGNAFISVLTASELLVGVHRALDEDVRSRRLAFVEGLLSALPVLPVDIETARVHAQMVAQVLRHETVGAHDALIGATALRHGHALKRGQYIYLWVLLADRRRIVARGRGDREEPRLTINSVGKRADPRAGPCETRDSIAIVPQVQIAR